eukprot:COSAG01_NODE_2555_length_7461_cov_2.868514_12_plen_61_part_00
MADLRGGRGRLLVRRVAAVRENGLLTLASLAGGPGGHAQMSARVRACGRRAWLGGWLAGC